jgi:deoxyribodipyrimidine photo-lyase
MPVVDYLQAARDARQRIYSARKDEGFRETAAKILSKHGSRKQRFPQKRRKTGALSRAAAGPADQLSLELARPQPQDPD